MAEGGERGEGTDRDAVTVGTLLVLPDLLRDRQKDHHDRFKDSVRPSIRFATNTFRISNIYYSRRGLCIGCDFDYIIIRRACC